MKEVPLPTGYLFVDEYSKGELETLSIGDYGKRRNVKADFLGYTDELRGVPNGECLPLSDKWVITISTQYGCPMRCTFCDVPKVPYKGNATLRDMQRQILAAISLFSEVTYTDRLNVHFARMGEPIFNPDVFALSRWLADSGKREIQDIGLRCEVIHPVLTTSLPKSCRQLRSRLSEWSAIKNEVFHGQAGLQLSINSTDDSQRNKMFSDMSLSLDDISVIANNLPDPIGRKYCLNFAYSTEFEIDARKLRDLFDCTKFMVKITPVHNSNACRTNGIETVGGYDSWEPYRDVEQSLREAGWDVLVFVPSVDEEDGLVTCGNAILGGGTIKCDKSVIRIRGIDRS